MLRGWNSLPLCDYHDDKGHRPKGNESHGCEHCNLEPSDTQVENTDVEEQYGPFHEEMCKWHHYCEIEADLHISS